MEKPPLSAFFAPQGVAVIGASQDPNKLGYGLARNLVQSNYRGTIHLVNPRGGSLLGQSIYHNIQEVPDPVDLAILLIPAPHIPQVLESCGQRGIPAVILASGGFRETGAEGAALEEICLEISRRYGMRMMGPNCIGLLDTHLPMNATFLPPPGPLPGDVAFISHSGAICAAVIDWARGQGFGLSRLVSLGNQADVNETDVLAPVATDSHTRVLTLYLEGISNGQRFIEEAQRISLQKPIIALKVGRFASGARAVASHTGALAGQENAFNAAFKKAGVIRANVSEELFDWARALAWCPTPKGRKVAVLTNAGGPGVTAADALEADRLILANLQESTRQQLQEALPPAASLQNPVDMLAGAGPEQYAACLHILLADAGVDSVMVILPPPPMHTAGAVAKAIIPIIHHSDKPVIVALMGERLIQEAVEHFRAAHIPEYRFTERAASALAILSERAEYLAQTLQTQEDETFMVNRGEVEKILAGILLDTGEIDSWLHSSQTPRILEAYGIPILPSPIASTVDEAVLAAQAQGLGDPDISFALKIASPDIPHKSDAGGVLLDLKNIQEIEAGFTKIMGNVQSACPEAHIDGVHVQRMIPDGQDVIIGAVHDAQFGALIMFGSGGVEVEGLKDVSFALAPLSRSEVVTLMTTTWAGQKLQGYRDLKPADQEAVIQTILCLAQLAVDFPQIAEIEINPLRVLAYGKGAYALDTRCRLQSRPNG